jgi:hypothetical protein
MDFTETACVCAVLLGIRKDRRKSDTGYIQWTFKGQFYKLYEELRNCRGTFFTYFKMSIESFDKLLVLVRPRITSEKKLDYACLCHHKRDWRNTTVRKYLFSHITVFRISYSVKYTRTIVFI